MVAADGPPCVDEVVAAVHGSQQKPANLNAATADSVQRPDNLGPDLLDQRHTKLNRDLPIRGCPETDSIIGWNETAV